MVVVAVQVVAVLKLRVLLLLLPVRLQLFKKLIDCYCQGRLDLQSLVADRQPMQVARYPLENMADPLLDRQLAQEHASIHVCYEWYQEEEQALVAPRRERLEVPLLLLTTTAPTPTNYSCFFFYRHYYYYYYYYYYCYYYYTPSCYYHDYYSLLLLRLPATLSLHLLLLFLRPLR